MPLIAHEVRKQYATIFNNNQIFDSRMRSLKYEDLMRGRIDLQKPGEFLSLPDLPTVNAGQDSGLVIFDWARESKFFSKLWGKEFYDSRIGRHKDELSDAQIATVCEITGRLRKLFDYG